MGDASFRDDVSRLGFELEQRAIERAVLDDKLAAAGLLDAAGYALAGEGLPWIRGPSESSAPQSPARRRCRHAISYREPTGMYTLTYWEAIGEQNELEKAGIGCWAAGQMLEAGPGMALDGRGCENPPGCAAWPFPLGEVPRLT